MFLQQHLPLGNLGELSSPPCPTPGLSLPWVDPERLHLLTFSFRPLPPLPMMVVTFYLLVQLTVRLKDICTMTKEKTARLIPNAIQVCTDTEKVHSTVFPSAHWQEQKTFSEGQIRELGEQGILDRTEAVFKWINHGSKISLSRNMHVFFLTAENALELQ